MADSKEKLFSDFPPVSTQEWMDKITVDLKGADFEKKLVWKTNEGFKVKPFYRQEDLEGLKTTEGLPGQFPYIRGNRKDDNTWFIRQNIRVESAEEANAKALDILNKGVDSLGFSIRKKDLSPEFIRTLLKDICCECVELNFSTCQGHTVQLAEMLTDYFREKGYDPTKLQGSVNYDPMEKMMQKGKDLSKFIDNARRLVEIFAPYPKFRCLAVNSLLLNNAGAYIYQELGYALAWGNEYLSQLTEAGVPAALAAKKIQLWYQLQLLHGNCQIPCSTYALGQYSQGIQTGLSTYRLPEHRSRRHLLLRLQDGCTCRNLQFQPDNLRCTCESAAYPDRGHECFSGRS